MQLAIRSLTTDRSSKRSRESPVIQFLGLFDTVKATNDHSLHDISYVDSINHVRHAIALNEGRQHFQPELYAPSYDPATLENRSMIQAWFVGAHADMGGGAKDDGLSLYPLQWVLMESQSFGLTLEHSSGRRFGNLVEDPIK